MPSCGRRGSFGTALLEATFPTVAVHEVEVYNPLADADQVDTIYVARKAGSIPVVAPTRHVEPPRRDRSPRR